MKFLSVEFIPVSLSLRTIPGTWKTFNKCLQMEGRREGRKEGRKGGRRKGREGGRRGGKREGKEEGREQGRVGVKRGAVEVGRQANTVHHWKIRKQDSNSNPICLFICSMIILLGKYIGHGRNLKTIELIIGEKLGVI